jgi:hypothetical protein
MIDGVWRGGVVLGIDDDEKTMKVKENIIMVTGLYVGSVTLGLTAIQFTFLILGQREHAWKR